MARLRPIHLKTYKKIGGMLKLVYAYAKAA